MLIDRQILDAIETGTLQIDPADGLASRIQPASLDVRLGHTFAVYSRPEVIDPKVDTSDLLMYTTVGDGDYFTVHPGELVLAATLETIGLGDTLIARVEGKSSLGRLGVQVHSTAGFIDPGWAQAAITLEISTQIGVPVRLYPTMPIAQLAFEEVAPVTAGYAGKYVSSPGPTPSRYHQNWTGSRWI